MKQFNTKLKETTFSCDLFGRKLLRIEGVKRTNAVGMTGKQVINSLAVLTRNARVRILLFRLLYPIPFNKKSNPRTLVTFRPWQSFQPITVKYSDQNWQL